MCEEDFRKTLTPEELERRAFIIPFRVNDFTLLEQLNRYSVEFERTWDELINYALCKLVEDIEGVHGLRR